MRIAVAPEIERLAREGAWFVASSSGGKDSGCAASVASEWLDSVGHPRDRRMMAHADLGRAEWDDTLDVVRATAAALGMPLEIVSAPRDLLTRFDGRWENCLRRYAALETIKVPPPWPGAGQGLFCRSEQKEVPLSALKAKLPGGLPVVGIVGMRRQESRERAKKPVVGPDAGMIRRNGRDGLLWNPIIDWTAEEVFARHAERGIPLHRAYGLGSTRLSCAACVLGSASDLATSHLRGGNVVQFRTYAALEIRSAFPFQPGRWISDLVGGDGSALADAKRIAAERVAAQRDLPPSVLNRRSIVGIEPDEADALASVRGRIADLYGIAVEGRTGRDVLEMASSGRG